MQELRRLVCGILGVLSVSLGQAQTAFDDDAFEASEAAHFEEREERFFEAHALLMSGKKRPAFRELKFLAGKGHSKAQYLLAVCYSNGLGTWKSAKQGARWFQESADSGYPLAWLALGEMSLSGDGVPQSYEEAFKYLEPLSRTAWTFESPLEDYAMERSVRSRAAFLVGMLYIEGWGKEKDEKRAIELLSLSSQTGDSMASMYLAMAYAKGEIVPRDVAASKRFFELSDLQSFDTVRRSLEAAMLENADEAIRKDFEDAAKELSRSHSESLFRTQTSYAFQILDEESEEYDPVFARALLKMAAEAGYKQAQCEFGRLASLGIGGEQDYAMAWSWFEKASEQGWIMAEFYQGILLLKGLGVEADLERGRKLIDGAAESGLYSAQLILDGELEADFVSDIEDLERCRAQLENDSRAVYAMERRKQFGWMVTKENASKSQRELLRKAADSGYARAQYAYAEYHYWGLLGEKNYELARQYFQRASDQRHAQSYFKIAYIYENGLGVEEDADRAKLYYELSCDFGDEWAANNLGAMYTDGDFGEPDYERAHEYYLLAVDRGNAVACYNLGDAYRLGRGCEQNMDTAVDWYSKAAEEGDLQAAKKLIELYRDGSVRFEDDQLAYWAEKAAELGDRASMWAISGFYMDGTGVPKSPAKAAYWVSAYIGQLGTFDSSDRALLRYSELLLEEDWLGYDPKEAMKLLNKLSHDYNDSTELRALLLLAKVNLEEKAPKTNAKRGVSLLKKAYNRSYKKENYRLEAGEAAYRLSRCYAKGTGVKQSDKEQFEWMEKAAEVGLRRAQYFLAVYRIYGVGGLVDLKQGVSDLEGLSRTGMFQATLKLGELIRDGIIEQPLSDELTGRLKELAASGNAKAEGLLISLGIEKALPAREKEEDFELSPYAPTTLG